MRDLPQLSGRQRRLIQSAAAALPALRRDEFMAGVARRLVGEPSDAAVLAAVNATLESMQSAVA